MKSKASTCVMARAASIDARAHWSRYTLCEVGYEEYLGWFERVGKPHLFDEEPPENQRELWFDADWAKVS